MTQRVLLLVLAALLALLAPVAGMADSCGDCGPATGCCPAPDCACCLSGSVEPAVALRIHPGLSPTGRVVEPAPDPCPSSEPTGIFHVPKLPLS